MARSLSQQQIRELKKHLDERYDEILKQVRQELLKSESEHYIQLAGRVHDSGEESVADLLVDINLASIDALINEFRDTDAAPAHIAGLTYGICIDCDDDIRYERLQAYPMAKRCYRCQEKYEQTPPVIGHPSL